MADKKIRIKSSDGDVFDVDMNIAQQSVTIKTMLENIGHLGDNDAIPLPAINTATLKKVISWCNHHKNDQPISEDEETRRAMIEDKSKSDDISPWDQEFLKVEQGTLYEIMLAANYMDIEGLLQVCCKTTANMIRGKPVEEIRKHFNIQNDFTPAEEEQVRQENEWVEER
ncbi:hypothetical protein SNEBB_005566 [Seison nebaliae]|nr:hypothetical protein SNEBB_005566 [Seison nebaliae]